MLRLVKPIRFIPKFGVSIGLLWYHKYLHWLFLYFYWHRKSTFEIEKDTDASVKKAFKLLIK